MSHFPLTDIGNPNLQVRKRTLQTFKDKHRDLRTALETYFHRSEIDFVVEAAANAKCEDPLYSEFQITDTANVRIATSSKTLLSMFNKHLNMDNDDSDNRDNLTESHRNFFYNISKRTIACLVPDNSEITRINYEQSRIYHVHLTLKLVIEKKPHTLFISLEINEKNKDFSSKKDFSKKDIQSTVSNVPIQLDATLLCKKYSLQQAKNMSVGDIISLDKTDKITLKVNNKPIFLGKLIVDEQSQLGVKYE
ncbi:FliM/FliN family flagellar motor C-terminal domain-containing protein [Vibrio algivorus]|uniref:FliM/FliN family flagellar motor switch protein n=1 Tax=Vibrio algivorus TaxID=1667024 RepID=A0A557P2N3_9VIBR|nr:FliM/FliN family flagellar motor C-terminal domain-containing protein [Vibrio algivorus]TVO34922.1 FliM/FliN family flagellar motor switch protein [Vibrio algivorus]